MREKTVEENENTPLYRVFQLSGTGFSHTTPMRSTGQSCAVSGTPSSLPALQRSSPPFSCYFCISFSNSLSFSAAKHKNSSHNISPIFTKNAITAIIFFCYSVSVKLLLLSFNISITVILFDQKFHRRHPIIFPVL